MQQQDVELAKKFFMSMGMNLDPIKVTSDDILEMGGWLGGHYTIAKRDDGFHVERLNHECAREDGPVVSDVPVGVYSSLPRALDHVATDIIFCMAQVFFEPYAEAEYGMPALEPR